MNSSQKTKANDSDKNQQDPLPIRNYDTNDLKEIEKDADKVRSKKPGSQSNNTEQHNNGRGGGK